MDSRKCQTATATPAQPGISRLIRADTPWVAALNPAFGAFFGLLNRFASHCEIKRVMPLKQDNESPYPISEIQILYKPDQDTELGRRSFHIEREGLFEPVHEYFSPI